MSKVVCDVAVRTGEASWRPQKEGVQFKLQGIWWDDDMYYWRQQKEMDYNLSFRFCYKKDISNEQGCVWRWGPHRGSNIYNIEV